MNYLFLAYSDEKWESLSVAEREMFGEACQANMELLQESGYLLATVDMQRDTAITVRAQHGRVLLSNDPPAASAKLVRLFFIDARDLNEAIQLAAKMPQIKCGPVSIWLPSG